MFENRESHARSPAHEVALDCLAAGIRRVDPERATRDAFAVDDDRLEITTDEHTAVDLTEFDRVLVLGGGKAAPGVVRALDARLGGRIDDGLIVVPEDDPAVGESIGAVAVEGGGHPLPTPEGVAATEELLELAETADERTLVLAAVTGGASALLAAPAGELSVGDLRRSSRALLDAGADIDEINAVRKHTSRVKGGRLAAAAAPATVVTLAVSDVVGDPPSVIGSGPTVPDGTTYADALSVIDRHGVDVPAVRTHLDAGDAGEYPETPGTDAELPGTTHVVAGARTAIDAAATAAAERGYEPSVLSSRVRGAARATAPTHVAIAEEAAIAGDPVEPPAVLLSGGEATVDVHGEGEGGPNTEFALAAALSLAGSVDGAGDEVVVAAIDTDGRDGATDAAGALVDAETIEDREAARDALERNDSLGYLGDRDAALVTGPTGTNVNDLRVLVVPDRGD
ncbi:glycerate kinase type-2 family protein [Halolamina sp. C58]|uniref:glycerate kinase type-2 family protein n=1 Tax=Halolamina sp. C58 TaxID=3421640 RepID=UPI003EBA0B91